jgi:hypothetical protein
MRSPPEPFLVIYSATTATQVTSARPITMKFRNELAVRHVFLSGKTDPFDDQ